MTADAHDPAAELHPAVDNRRNWYRVLHVQPEAPMEVIRASWRTLMARLHPDAGGAHADAALVNAAWQVLGDPQRRAAYDRELRRHTEAARAVAGTSSAGAAMSQAYGGSIQPGSTPCPLCAQTGPCQPRPDTRCLRCEAPLAALPLPGSLAHELLGRRGAARRDRGHAATLRVGWPSPELPVRWRDLSLTGLSLWAPQPLPAGRRIHLIDHALELVGEVVDSRPQGRLHSVHARLLTLMPKQATGVFVSATA